MIAEVQPGLSVAEALHLDLADCLKAIGFCSEKKGPVEYVWLHNLSDEAFSVYPNSLGQVEKSIDLSPRSAKKIPCSPDIFQYIFFRKTDPTRTVKVVPVHPRPHPAPTP